MKVNLALNKIFYSKGHVQPSKAGEDDSQIDKEFRLSESEIRGLQIRMKLQREHMKERARRTQNQKLNTKVYSKKQYASVKSHSKKMREGSKASLKAISDETRTMRVMREIRELREELKKDAKEENFQSKPLHLSKSQESKYKETGLVQDKPVNIHDARESKSEKNPENPENPQQILRGVLRSVSTLTSNQVCNIFP